MDCEKYEPLLLDELYEELDELTSAAVKRHVSGCARCNGILQGLRATRRAAVLPFVDPPADLEDRILAAAREAQKVVPLRGRVATFVSRAGSWAMRPQTAMAAVFMLVIGSSAFLLRSGADRRAKQSAVSVMVAGEPSPAASVAAPSSDTLSTPAAEAAHGATVAPAAPAPVASAIARKAKDDVGGDSFGDSLDRPRNAEAPAGAAPMTAGASRAAAAEVAGGEGGEPFAAGMAAYRARSFVEATRQFDAAAASGDVNAALWAAKSTRDGSGCGVALGRFDAVAQRAQGTWHGSEAQLEAARCELALGQLDAARDRLKKLSTVASHAAAAKKELEQADQIAARRATTKAGGGGGAGGAAAAPKPAAKAPSAAPLRDDPAKPAATSGF